MHVSAPTDSYTTTNGHFTGIVHGGTPVNCHNPVPSRAQNDHFSRKLQRGDPYHLHYHTPGPCQGKEGVAVFIPRFPVGVNATRVGLQQGMQQHQQHQQQQQGTRRAGSARGASTYSPSSSLSSSTSFRGLSAWERQAEGTGERLRAPPRQSFSPVPPSMAQLKVGVVTREGNKVNLRHYAWPSDRSHTEPTVLGTARGLPSSESQRPRTHRRWLTEATTPRVQYPPKYAAHVPRLAINTQSVGLTAGDASEEALAKRVVRGNLDEDITVLRRILPDIPAVPESIPDGTYRKDRLPVGRSIDKAALQRTFSTEYRSANPKLESFCQAAGSSLLGTLKNNAFRDDDNATPFPPTPRR
jgi:hypothetical protein